jgi:hypothetical protein
MNRATVSKQKDTKMALVQTCKCEECGAQKSFANHWVMLLERGGTLIVLPAWDEKKIRRTRHFCGRAHAGRFIERWIANPETASLPDGIQHAENSRVTQFPRPADFLAITEEEEDANIAAMALTVRYA